MLNVWLDAGLDLGNHSFSHINIHRTTADAYLADVDAGAPVVRAALEARGDAPALVPSSLSVHRRDPGQA